MAERERCANCTDDRRKMCDQFYGRYVELQERMGASFIAYADELIPQYPGVATEGPVRDTLDEFTEWHQSHAIRIAREQLGCELEESVIRENFTKAGLEGK